MWTPLLLICFIDRPDCAIPNAPAYPTKEQCREALEDAAQRFRLPPNMMIVAGDCYGWGRES